MPPYAFPADLARAVQAAWTTRVVGVFNRPPLPQAEQLEALLTVAYLASQETDEGRPTAFTICLTPEVEAVQRFEQDDVVEAWTFAAPRACEVEEVRRLAVTTDMDCGALWVTFGWSLGIKGLLNLGPSWADARQGFAFHYDTLPHALTVRVEGPGSLTVYQGQVALVSLVGGRLRESEAAALGLHGLDGLIDEGQQVFDRRLEPPGLAPARLAAEFQWAAYTNVLMAVVNAIRQRGHGGALILAGAQSALAGGGGTLVRMKYQLRAPMPHVVDRFVELVSRRHALADLQWRLGDEMPQIEPPVPPLHELRLAYAEVRDAFGRLAESCRFVGQLAGTDGAIVMRTDLAVMGFGAEILLDKMPPAPVYELTGMSLASGSLLDSEQFGMRHRSAMRLCASVPDVAVFIVSQDGGVGLVFHHDGRACFRRNISTTTTGMAYA